MLTIFFDFKIGVMLFIVLALTACRYEKRELCSSDFTKSITIVDEEQKRTIYYKSDGDLSDDKSYVKLDISKIDLESDGIFVCWNDEHGKISIVNPKSIILEENINKNFYSFSSNHDVDSLGLPKILKFHQEGCFEFNLLSNSIFPKNNSVIDCSE